MQPTYWARTHVWNRIFTSDVYIWLDSVKFSRSATKWEDRTVVEASDGRPGGSAPAAQGIQARSVVGGRGTADLAQTHSNHPPLLLETTVLERDRPDGRCRLRA